MEAVNIENENQIYEYWFANIQKLSNRKKKSIRKKVKSAKDLYYIEETRMNHLMQLTDQDFLVIQTSKNHWNMKKEYEKLEAKKVTFLTINDIRYPTKLRNIDNAPYALYVKGKLPDEQRPSVAIVGARRCSPYGEYYAREFANVLGEADVQIISGLAKGIDGISQRAAIQAGGDSYGILACGVDICYPQEHFGLYMDLQEQGGVISEQSLSTPALPSYFPARNRIISGLADIVLVIEAKEKSGSLITADMALEQGKDVYALPGPINSSMSYGCNWLIKQGAGVLISPEDLLVEMNLFGAINKKKSEEKKIILESAENMLYSCLDLHPKNLNQLAEEIKIPVREIMSLLISLELKGLIKELSKNYYVKIK